MIYSMLNGSSSMSKNIESTEFFMDSEEREEKNQESKGTQSLLVDSPLDLIIPFCIVRLTLSYLSGSCWAETVTTTDWEAGQLSASSATQWLLHVLQTHNYKQSYRNRSYN